MTGPKIRALELVVSDLDALEVDEDGELDFSTPTMLRGRALASHVASRLNGDLSGEEIARTGGYALDRCVEMLVRSGYGRLGGALLWRVYDAANLRTRDEYVTVLAEAAEDEALFAEEAAWLEYLAA